MKLFMALIIIMSSNLGLAATSKPGKSAKTRVEYFYCLPEELSGNDGWATQIPECSILSTKVRAGLVDCEKFDGHTVCYSKEPREFQNILTKEKVKVRVLFHIFSSISACQSDRQNLLESDE